MIIQSRQNPKIKAVRSLLTAKGRKETGLHLIEGVRLVRDALQSGANIIDLFILQGLQVPDLGGFPVTFVSEEVIAAITDSKSPQGIVAVVRTQSLELPSQYTGSFLLLLDNIQDPGNMGTILRSADAFGVSGVFLSSDCTDPFAPKALRSAMGSTYHLPIWKGNAESALKQMISEGYLPICGHLQGTGTLPGQTEKIVLVIGNEGNGVRDSISSQCLRYKIPMFGNAESLNASVAAGILMYAISNILHSKGK